MTGTDKIKEVIAPSLSTRQKLQKAISDYSIYMIIVLVTSVVVFIPPLVGGAIQGDVSIFFPVNAAGWVLWGMTNGGAAIGNVSLLVLFKMQAKKNVRDNESFKKANDILNALARERAVFVPRSPAKMNAADYTTKIIFIVLSTLSSFMVISSIIISFDVVTLISTVLSAVVALCFSWVTMLNNEEYWTGEYLLYAEMLKKKMEEKPNDNNRRNDLAEPGRAGGQEPERHPGA